MKSIQQIYNTIIESLVTERLLNRDIEQRIKTDKSYNPEALDFYKFLKTKNISYEFYHGTTQISYECMKKDGFIISPFLRGVGDFEKRKEEAYSEYDAGIKQIYFTTSYDNAEGYARRETNRWRDDKKFVKGITKKYNFSEDFIEKNNKPIILKIKIPLYLLTEISMHIYDEKYRNEFNINKEFRKVILNKKIPNEKKLENILKVIKNHYYNKYREGDEFTTSSILPISRINGMEFISTNKIKDDILHELTLAIDKNDVAKLSKLLNKNNIKKQKKELEYIISYLFEHNSKYDTVIYIYILDLIDINSDTAYDAFIKSIKNNNKIIIKYFIDKGIDIHKENDYALSAAAGANNFELVKYLIEHKANASAMNNNPLAEACIINNLEIVKYLIKYGAFPTDFIINHIVKNNGRDEIYNYLIGLKNKN